MAMKEIDWIKFLTDIVFYGLGSLLFFNSVLISMIAISLVMYLLFAKELYKKSNEIRRFNHFVDFLNQLHANLSVGIQFNNAILNLKESHFHEELGVFIMDLKKIIQYSGAPNDIYKAIIDQFKLEEANVFVQLLQQATETGTQVAGVVNITLEQLYFKSNIRRTVESIIFQKKLEHSLLVMAPLMILIFLRITSGGYIEVLYTQIEGRVIMALAFATITFMKWLGHKLTNISLDL